MTAQLSLPWVARAALADRYAEWAQTAAGQEVLRMAEELALAQAAAGAKRISIAWIWESIRRARRQSADNSFRAFVARRLRELHPPLRDLIKLKEQRAA